VSVIGATPEKMPSDASWADSLMTIVTACRAEGLPVEPIDNKIREGRAKNRTDEEIYAAVKIRHNHLIRLRTANPAMVPSTLTKQLYLLEESTQAETKVAQQNTSRQTPAISSTAGKHSAAGSVTVPAAESKHLPKHGSSPRDDSNRIEKIAAKSDRTMDKAAARAEKRMETIERKLQKRAEKGHSGDR
jgi:hypothetical protein